MRQEWAALNPGHRVRGCSFHYAQAVQRRVQAGGLAHLYHNYDSLVGKAFTGAIWMALSLPSVPLHRYQLLTLHTAHSSLHTPQSTSQVGRGHGTHQRLHP